MVATRPLTLMLIGYIVGLILFLFGVIPALLFLVSPVMLVGGYLAISIIYPYIRVAGKDFLGISVMLDPERSIYAFGLVEEVQVPQYVIEGMPDYLKDIDTKVLFVRLSSFPFLPTVTPFNGALLVFDPKVIPEKEVAPNKFKKEITLMDLKTRDVISPKDVDVRIPIHSAFLAGVYIGSVRIRYPTKAFFKKSFWDKLKESLGKEVQEEEMEEYPIVYITWSKPHDMIIYSSIKETRRVRRDILTEAGLKSYIDKLGYLRIESTETVTLAIDKEMLEEELRSLKKTIIRGYHPESHFIKWKFMEEGKKKLELPLNKWMIAGLTIGITVFILGLLIALGVIH